MASGAIPAERLAPVPPRLGGPAFWTFSTCAQPNTYDFLAIWRGARRVGSTDASDGRLARVGRIDRSIGEPPCARRCRRTEARKDPHDKGWLRRHSGLTPC